MTFSIVGFDPNTGELGVAVQSKFLGVGAVVPWAKAGVGAVATQSWARTTFGPDGLAMMQLGLSAEDTLKHLLAGDDRPEVRQVGIVDAKGRSATFTGEGCYPWAGGITGPNFAAQGNILVNEETVKAMADVFQQAEGDLATRLLQALDAGQEAGGDSRGQQSAALLVVKEGGGYSGFNDRYIDLRVDDHPQPIKELIRLHKMYQLYFYKTKPEDILAVEGQLKAQIADKLIQLGYLQADHNGDDETFFKALDSFILTENFDERIQERGYIDREVVAFMMEMK